MNNELIAVLDYLERDRGLEREMVTKMIEESLVTAARRAVGPVNDLRVTLNPKTGDIQAIARLAVVEKVVNPEKEIEWRQARIKFPEVELGEEVDWEVTPRNFGRIAAQTAKQGLLQRLRQAEKTKIQDEFSGQVGDLLYGTVSRLDKGEVIINFGRAEGVLNPHQRVPNEDYRIGDHISCILSEVNANRHGPILVVSRTAPELVKCLFEREVAEIAEKIVVIKAVAREPGYRSKIAVHSSDSNVDPVGACVGLRGSRVKTIVRELSGEKVDIIRWDPDNSIFITNALQPATIKTMEIDQENHRVIVTVDKDQLSLAIGKHGQNARLTSKLTGWKVDIRKIEEKKEHNFEEKVKHAIDHLAELPGISHEIAEILVNNGFLSIEGLKAASIEDFMMIEGIDAETAKAISVAVS